jgi:cytochrome c oxidase subunit 1
MVMGVAPMMVVFGAIYHWYPLITGRMYDETLGKVHFWVTFLGAYLIYFPMHYLGFVGVPRRYFELGETQIFTESVGDLNAFISIMTFIVGAAQILFFYNMARSYFVGKKAGHNPWGAASLEWQTPEVPPGHGNWGKQLPLVYRWAYDYGVPGAVDDFVPQNMAPKDVPMIKKGRKASRSRKA